MDCFKLKPGVNRIFTMEKDVYLSQTQKKPPYCRVGEDGKQHYYALCPECDNPIQIVGLFVDTIEAGRRPYGRHHKGDVPGLAKYNETDYLDCIYADPNWKRPKGKRSAESKLAKQILSLLREQFDRIIYILSKDMEVRISAPLSKKLLRYFLDDEAWRYRMTTLNNLPWSLGEAAPATPLFGQWISRNSELQAAIEKGCPAAGFVETKNPDYVQVKNKEGMYLDLTFFFLNHNKWLDEETGTVKEAITLEVDSGKECIYQKDIPIRSDYFLNLISDKKKSFRRNKKLLDIAHELISE